jgi:hypothetical protein
MSGELAAMFSALFTTVISGLLVAGIVGIIIMFRQIGELNSVMANLASTVAILVRKVERLDNLSLRDRENE